MSITRCLTRDVCVTGQNWHFQTLAFLDSGIFRQLFLRQGTLASWDHLSESVSHIGTRSIKVCQKFTQAGLGLNPAALDPPKMLRSCLSSLLSHSTELHNGGALPLCSGCYGQLLMTCRRSKRGFDFYFQPPLLWDEPLKSSVVTLCVRFQPNWGRLNGDTP